jgi:HIRAN domain
MDRRSFFSRLGALCGGALVSAPAAAQAAPKQRIELQRSAVAGFQYHDGEKLWASLRIGDALTLAREADNVYDKRAVRVDWHGRKLGYVPRLDNASVSHLLDSGVLLEIEIVSLRESYNPWDRIGLAVHLIV